MLQELDLDRLQAWSGEMQNWSGEKDAVFAMLDLELSQTLKELEAQIQDLSGEIDALDQDHQTELDQLSKQVADLITMIAQTDGLVVRNHEQLKVQVDSLSQRNQQLERDLQNIAVLLEQEKQNRNLQSEGLNSKIAELSTQLEFLSTQVGVSEEELAALSKKISDEIAVQMNAAIIRERGLSGTVAELEAEFDAYKIATQAEIKSAKSTAMIAIAAAAIAVVIGFIQ